MRALPILALLCSGCVMLGPEDQAAWEDRLLLTLEPTLPPGFEDQLEGAGSFVLTLSQYGAALRIPLDWTQPGDPLQIELPTIVGGASLILEGFSGTSDDPAFLVLRGRTGFMELQGGQHLEIPIFLTVVDELVTLDAPASFGAAVAADGQGGFWVVGGSAAGMLDDAHAIARDSVMRLDLAGGGEPGLVEVGPIAPVGQDGVAGLMNASATRLGGGDRPVLIAGGWEAFGRVESLSDQLLLFEPSLGETTIVGALDEPRAGHAAFELDSGLVLIAGGYADAGDGSLDCARTVEVVDPDEGVVIASSAQLDHCLLDGAGASLGEAVLWCGGARWDDQGFGAEPGCWVLGGDGSVEAAPWPLADDEGLLLPAMATLGPDRALLVGGAPVVGELPTLATGDEDWAWASDRAWIYDHRYGMFKETDAPMHQPRAGHAAVGLGGARVLVAGGALGLTNRGTNVRDPSACAEVYDLASNSWELIQPCSGELSSLPGAVHRPSVAADPSYGALVLGGLDYLLAAPDLGLYAPAGR